MWQQEDPSCGWRLASLHPHERQSHWTWFELRAEWGSDGVQGRVGFLSLPPSLGSCQLQPNQLGVGATPVLQTLFQAYIVPDQVNLGQAGGIRGRNDPLGSVPRHP